MTQLQKEKQNDRAKLYTRAITDRIQEFDFKSTASQKGFSEREGGRAEEERVTEG